MCGEKIPYKGNGRRPTYCAQACRQKAWGLRNAERALGTAADTRPAVVREVFERDAPHVSPVPPAATTAAPTTARQWVELINQLRVQLGTTARQ